MKGASLLIYLFLQLLHYSSFCQEYSYVHYDVKDGLAGSTVYSMVQDRDGFIWFGTETGLSRFDGTNFRNFSVDDGLPDNEIIRLKVDSRNRIWIMPFKHTIAYYWHGKIHTQENDSLLKKLKISGFIGGVQEDLSGNLLLKEEHCLHIIDTSGKISEIQSSNLGQVLLFLEVGLNRKFGFCAGFISKGRSICFGDIEGGRLVAKVTDIKAAPNSASDVYLGPDLRTLRNGDSLIFFHLRDSTAFKMRVPPGYINPSHINDSLISLNTYSGTYLVNIYRRKIVDTFLIGPTINGTIEDNEGNYWFSTFGKGVYRLGSSGVKNYNIRENGNNLTVSMVKMIDSILYVGAEHHILCRVNKNSGLIERVRLLDLTASSRGRVSCMVSRGNREMLIGADGGIFRLKAWGERPVRLFGPVSVKSLFLWNDSTVLFCTGYMTSLNPLNNFNDIDTIWPKRATCAQQDRFGNIYIGTLDGLYRVDPRRKTSFLGDRDQVFNGRITAVTEAPDGMIWVATYGRGVVGYKDGKVIYHISEKEGLTSNICKCIYVAGGNIWVGTDRGLNKLMPAGGNYTVIRYAREDGLNADMVNAVCVQDRDIWVGTQDGLTYFNELKISKRSDCILRLTGLIVSNAGWPADTSGFVLPHKDNNIQFQFAGISFKSGGGITYHYRLLGLDTMWRVTRENSLDYPSLPSGDYELQLTATNKFGVQSRMASVKFAVGKLLIEKAWFRILFILVVALLINILFRYRIMRIRKKEKERADTSMRIAELEQMALRSQMNPHFIFNCLNSIQRYVIDKDVLGSNEFITQFSSLIRQTLNYSTRAMISIYDEIQYITTYMELEKKRFEDKFIYEIVVQNDVDVHQYHIPPMILQPYVENAIRHGIGLRPDKKGKLTFSILKGDGTLDCVVEDNGVGRKRAAQLKSANSISYQSVGMSLVAKRIEMFNKTARSPVRISIVDMEDPAGSPMGTRVIVHFPLEIVRRQS